VLTIGGAELEAVVAHCRRELPNEACGLLGGRAGRVESVHPAKNVQASPSRFAMDPLEQLRAMEEIRKAGREIAGIYHSHPGGPAGMSSLDREEACWPGTSLPNFPDAVQVVVSLRDRNAPEVRAFAPAAGSFVEVRVVVL